MNFPTGRRFSTGVLLILAACLAASYCNSFGIRYELDDAYVIESNPWIRSLANIPRFFVDPFTSTTIRDNVDLRPIPLITFALNYAISGLEPWSYHLLSLLVHLAVAILVFFIVRDFLWWPASDRGPDGAARLPAAAAALFFALAPLNSQPVVYVSARSATLATVFYLGALLAFAHRRWIAMAALHALAVLCKAIAVTLPATILLYDFLYRDRARYPTIRAYLGDWRRLVAPISLVVAVDVLYIVYRNSFLPAGLRDVQRSAFVTPWIWFMSQWPTYLFYVRQFLWPDGLSVDHESIYVMSLGDPRAWQSLAVLLIWIGLAVRFARRQPVFAFGTFWFFVTLAPESSFLPLAEIANDHRPYLPSSLGLALLLAWALHAAVSALARRPEKAFVGVSAVLCLMAIPMNLHRNWIWQDSLRLWEDAVAKGPSHARAWMNAGRVHMARGDYEMARRYFDKSRGLAPQYSFLYLNRSALENLEGNLEAALREAEEGVRVAPNFSMAHFYHGSALERLGRMEEAAAAYARTLELDPNDARAKESLSRIENPDPNAVDMNAGVQAMRIENDPERAAQLFRQVLARNPDHYGAHLQLAKALDRLEQTDAALALWEKVLSMAEGYQDEATASAARARLADRRPPIEVVMQRGLDALYRDGDAERAVAEFRQVLERNSTHYGAHLQLAKALDRAGRPAEAVPLWEKVLRMAESSSDEETANTARNRLQTPTS